MTIPGGEVVDLLVELIRNACVNDGTADSGHEVRSVDTLAAYLGERGTEFEPHPGRRSTVYRLAGSDPRAPSLMLMGHLDVVPVSEEGWSRDPFGGERADGFVWGRGAVDMLNQTASMAAVFRRYLTGEARPLAGDLLFLAVADEEAGGKLGARWLVDEHWDTVRCDYLLTEIGTPFIHGEDGPGLPVTVAEKGPQWRRITSRGEPGHGSQPFGAANALVPLAAALGRLGDMPPGAHITDEWRRFVEAWAPSADLRSDLLDPERVDEAIERIALDDLGLARWIHACTHLTISPNTLVGGQKANVIPDLAVAEIDTRSLPGQDESDVIDHFRKVIGPGLDEFDVETVEATPASGSDPSGPLWDALEGATSDVAPGVKLVPALIPVGTDARFFRRRGTVAYGVGLFDDRVDFGDFLRMFHGHDERVSEESLALTAQLIDATVERFGQLSAS
jgi:acetylornithine deacetylase/succinyl-diaminopimelate desuccinylase-like protein